MNKMSWQVLKKEILAKNKYVTFYKETVKLPNNKILDDYFTVKAPDVVIIMALTKNKELIMNKEYRHAIEQTILQTPGGYVDNNNPLESAKKELLEESGYQSNQWQSLGVVIPNPPRTTTKEHLFLALNAKKVAEQKLEPAEQIETLLVPYNHIKDLFNNKDFCVPGCIVGLHRGLEVIRMSKKR